MGIHLSKPDITVVQTQCCSDDKKERDEIGNSHSGRRTTTNAPVTVSVRRG